MLVRFMLVGVITLASAANAQPPGRGRDRGPFGPPPDGFGGARFLGAEPGMPGRVVKNAPYSADLTTESTQTLPDGNHIRRTITTRAYRDSEGRTRREQSLRTLGGLASNANLPQVVFIDDPVAGVNYALNPDNHTASRSTWNRPSGRGEHGGRASAEMPSRVPRSDAANANSKTESLGRQTMEGLAADGTRTTWTIPAGQIGNEQPIVVVTETWYSPDLKMPILSKRSDPRTGETTTRMSNITRAEPAHSLFEVPADFKVHDSASRPQRSGQ